jgi:thiol-disulfide isomerase/thioredoxin
MKSWLSALLLLLAAPAMCAEVAFDQAQFDSLRAAGKPLAVVFHADWCPTCRAQAPVLEKLANSPEFAGVTVFVANFDTEKALKRSLGVTQQSTVVVFKGGKESARSTGESQADALTALLRHAVS